MAIPVCQAIQVREFQDTLDSRAIPAPESPATQVLVYPVTQAIQGNQDSPDIPAPEFPAILVLEYRVIPASQDILVLLALVVESQVFPATQVFLDTLECQDTRVIPAR